MKPLAHFFGGQSAKSVAEAKDHYRKSFARSVRLMVQEMEMRDLAQAAPNSKGASV